MSITKNKIRIKSFTLPPNMKRGYVREDGYVFVGYRKADNYPAFLSPQALAKQRESQRRASHAWYAKNKEDIKFARKIARSILVQQDAAFMSQTFGSYTKMPLKEKQGGIVRRFFSSLFATPLRAVAATLVFGGGFWYATSHPANHSSATTNYQQPTVQGSSFSF